MANTQCRKKAPSHCWKAVLALAINILITRISVSECTNHAYDQSMNEIDQPDAKHMQNHDPILFTTIGQEHLPLTEMDAKRFRPEIAVLNVGRGFKPSIGYFVAPRDGVYLFNFVGLIYNLPTDVTYPWINMAHQGHPEHDSLVAWKLTDPMTSAGHSLVSMKKDDVMEYHGRMDSYWTNYLEGLEFIHDNWWRLSGRYIADLQDPDAVAFSVAGILNDAMQSPTEWMLVQFNSVHLNTGSGYNSSSATFVAPTSGLYHFFLQFPGRNELQGEARIQKVDLLLAAGLVGEFEHITVDIDVICELQEGESVFVSMLGSIGGTSGEIKFSGFRME